MVSTSIEKEVLSYIDSNKQEMFEMLSNLVKIDTQNFITHGNENPGQLYLANICEQMGLTVDVFAPDSVEGLTESDEYNPGRKTDERKNLVAIFNGEKSENGIMLAAHMDTMPVGDLSLWDDSPFSGEIRDDKIYGRGSGDDKFGIAVAWFVIKALQECGIKPKKNILLGSYVDEEYGGGNGALGLSLKYPCDCFINLDSSGFEKIALGGGCFEFKVRSTQNDKGIASVFDVFNALTVVKEELEVLNQESNTTVRLSMFNGGEGGTKEGLLSFAIYTDKSQQEIETKLSEIFERAQVQLQKMNFISDGFQLTTKFFRYGETKQNSVEADILAEAICEVTGVKPETKGSCLSDLSIFLYYGSKNSFSYGIPRGSKNGGGAHQPNEHICCDKLLECAKSVALLLLRI